MGNATRRAKAEAAAKAKPKVKKNVALLSFEDDEDGGDADGDGEGAAAAAARIRSAHEAVDDERWAAGLTDCCTRVLCCATMPALGLPYRPCV